MLVNYKKNCLQYRRNGAYLEFPISCSLILTASGCKWILRRCFFSFFLFFFSSRLFLTFLLAFLDLFFSLSSEEVEDEESESELSSDEEEESDSEDPSLSDEPLLELSSSSEDFAAGESLLFRFLIFALDFVDLIFFFFFVFGLVMGLRDFAVPLESVTAKQ